jgi:type II secretory pathway component PulF
MKYKKGNSGNPKGKPKGAKNKVTLDLRKAITDFLTNNFNEVVTEWQKTKGKEKLTFYRDLLRYSVPMLQAIELTTDFDKMTDEQLDSIINELKNIVTNGQTTKN